MHVQSWPGADEPCRLPRKWGRRRDTWALPAALTARGRAAGHSLRSQRLEVSGRHADSQRGRWASEPVPETPLSLLASGVHVPESWMSRTLLCDPEKAGAPVTGLCEAKRWHPEGKLAAEAKSGTHCRGDLFF